MPHQILPMPLLSSTHATSGPAHAATAFHPHCIRLRPCHCTSDSAHAATVFHQCHIWSRPCRCCCILPLALRRGQTAGPHGQYRELLKTRHCDDDHQAPAVSPSPRDWAHQWMIPGTSPDRFCTGADLSHSVRCPNDCVASMSGAEWLAEFHYRFASTTICPPCGEWWCCS